MSQPATLSWNEAESAEAVMAELERLNAKLDRLTEAVLLIDRRREELEEWVADLMPAANGAVTVATRHLAGLEANGALPMARELLAALETAANRVDPEDVRAIADNADVALETLRLATSPEVGALARGTVDALGHARTGRPPRLTSLLRKARKPHVRRGFAAMLEILGALGGGARPTAPASRADRVSPSGGARRAAPSPRARPVRSPAPPADAAPTGPSRNGHPTVVEIGGRTVDLDSDGFLVDPGAWTREVAEKLARDAGIGPLTGDHWEVLEFCRNDAGESGNAPGLRRITQELGIPPRKMYTLFPKGPGVLAARLAGLGKPRSCV